MLRVPVPAFADRFHGGPELVGGLQENFASSCNYIQNPETIDWLRRIPGPFDQEAVSRAIDGALTQINDP